MFDAEGKTDFKFIQTGSIDNLNSDFNMRLGQPVSNFSATSTTKYNCVATRDFFCWYILYEREFSFL